MASGKAYLAKRDPLAAAIQFKNVLQRRPQSGEARLLLGKSLAGSGDPVSAIVEFGKALELAQPAFTVVPELARALLANREFRRLTDTYGTTVFAERLATADLMTSVAVAFAAQGDRPRSKAALQTALNSVPDHPRALLVTAQSMAEERRYDEALDLIRRLESAAFNEPELFQLKGDVELYGKADAGKAASDYRKALEIDPGYIPARINAIRLSIARSDFKVAREDLEQLRKRAPKQLLIRYFDAQFAYADKDYNKARELIRQVLSAAPNDTRFVQFAGLIEFSAQSFAAAERHLTKALELSPQLAVTRLLLARTCISLGQPARAVELLAPLLASAKPSAEVLALAGDAFLRLGNIERAEASFNSAATLNPLDTRSRTALAISHFMQGNGESAYAELESISKADQKIYADQALVGFYLRSKAYDKALAAIDRIESKQPDKPTAVFLRGQVFLLKGDKSAARVAFEKALKLDRSFFPAVSALASLDISDKQFDAARKRYDAILAIEANHLPALLSLASLQSQVGKPEEVVPLLMRAINSHAEVPEARLALVNYQLSVKNAAAALAAARDAATALPQNADIIDALARSQIAAGENNQAIKTLNQLVTLQPRSTQPYLRLASIYANGKDWGAARQALGLALQLVPNLVPAQKDLVQLELAAGRLNEALSVARQVQKQRPREPVGFLLEGAVFDARQDPAAAAQAYRTGLRQIAAPELAIKLYASLLASKNSAEADKFASNWLTQHPKDAGFMFYLGEVSITAARYANAESRFRQVLAILPENALVLNNIAWLMAKQKKPGAVSYAQRATQLMPDRPALLDTLATALLVENQVSQAIEVGKKALALSPDSAALRFSLAKMYVQAGDKSAARAQLNALAKLGNKFSGEAEVNRLLATL